jgi:hypothetical protein
MKHGLEADIMRPFRDEKAKKFEFTKRIIFQHIDVDSLNSRRTGQGQTCVVVLRIIIFADVSPASWF